MKKIITILLCCALLFCGCIVENEGEKKQETDKSVEFIGMDDPSLLPYISDQVYENVSRELVENEFIVEDIQTRYISKEYIEENEYNSKENIYFGYTLSEIAEQFDGKSYVFDLDEAGKTDIHEVVTYDDSYDKMIKNVIIGSGVILVCATVALITKSPAMTAEAGKTVKLIFAISTNAVNAGTKMAFSTAAISGTISSIIEATKTNDIKQILKTGLLQATDGFKWGAIFGTVKGAVDGVIAINNTKYFNKDKVLAQKYPQGVEFTQGKDGVMYPRFEKYAKATAKFKMPNKGNSLSNNVLNGNRYHDAKLANAQCGFSQTPDGYVWHHVEDMQTMLLVPQDLHGGMYHIGGASLIQKLLLPEGAAA